VRVIIAAALTCAASVATAAPADCIKVTNDLDRLACYDKEAGRTPTVETLPAPAASPWLVRQETSKLTDQPTVVMSVESNETINCGWNRGQKISLVLRCMENKTVLYFSTGCHMVSSEYNDYGDITYRLDEEKSHKVGGDASTDNKALGLWSGGKSVPLIKQMLSKKQMTVRMTPYSESPFVATFNISGLGDAIKPLRQACGW
jgi:type VI secretion system protein VasI